MEKVEYIFFIICLTTSLSKHNTIRYMDLINAERNTRHRICFCTKTLLLLFSQTLIVKRPHPSQYATFKSLKFRVTFLQSFFLFLSLFPNLTYQVW